jgi:hypothetical protein
MTRGAERDQVLIGVVAGVAAKLFVMDFQVRHRAAGLAPPAITPQTSCRRLAYATWSTRAILGRILFMTLSHLGYRGVLASVRGAGI